MHTSDELHQARRCSGLSLLLLAACFASHAVAQSPVGVETPPGFTASWYADDDLAHDIYCMTLDKQGRVVVSGAGYVRTLIDTDSDGRADAFETFVDGPASGAQGMLFDGNDLLCVGDGGLIRYRDQNADGRADGPAEMLLKIRTGGEHHAHAIRRGPDGYWYLLAGNDSQVTSDYVTAQRSPIRDPQAGTLLRLSPDFQECEVLADGFRNAYDFDFNDGGDIFVYDSDGERDISLPWYRPTRVFQIVPGGHAGWITRSWKRPNYFVDMPPVVAELGRGSPTGVACYRHTRFPVAFHGAVLVADWTFGRVVALHLSQDEHGVWHSTATPLITGAGAFGFAPTDLEVGLDGSLYVSVGGRGTRGGVLRVTANETEQTATTVDVDEPLDMCLLSPMPRSAWTRELYRDCRPHLLQATIEQAVLNANRPTSQRVRAIELLTESFAGLSPHAHQGLATAPTAVRARAAWSLGYGDMDIESRTQWLLHYLQDEQATVVSAALQAAFYYPQLVGEPEFLRIARQRLLDHPSIIVRQSTARLLAGSDADAALIELHLRADSLSPLGRLTLALALAERSQKLSPPALHWSIATFAASEQPEVRLAALRLLLLALGDIGPRDKRAAVFDGYALQHELTLSPAQVREITSKLAAAYPSGDAGLDTELERVLGVLQCDDGAVLERILKRIDAQSPLSDDIHRLIVAARCSAPPTAAHRAMIAAGLADLESKLLRQDLRQDRNWSPRLQEVLQAVVAHDPQFAEQFVNADLFGHPGHAMFLSVLPAAQRAAAIDRLLARQELNSALEITPELLEALGTSDDFRHRQFLRTAAEDPATRDAALANLARRVDEEDRELYFRGLASHAFDTIAACLSAVEKLSPPDNGLELAALVTALSRLQGDRAAYEARERVARLLHKATSETRGFQFGREGHQPQTEVIAAWIAWLQATHAEEAEQMLGPALDTRALDEQLARVDWTAGDAARGGALFRKKTCHQCHGGRQALGPDLAGAARRFSTRDLFTAIVFPNQTVSPRYQTIILETHDGQIYQGAVVYESVDGVTLITGTNRTIRVEAEDIANRSTSNLSLMPSGLLNELQPADYADLLAYLKTLDHP